MDFFTETASESPAGMTHLVIVHMGSRGYYSGEGYHQDHDPDRVSNDEREVLAALGDTLRVKVPPHSSVRIITSAYKVAQDTAEIIRSRLERSAMEVNSCLGYETDRPDRTNWRGDFGYDLAEIEKLIAVKRRDSNVLLLVSGEQVTTSLPGMFTSAEYGIKGIPFHLVPLYFGGLPRAHGWMLDLQQREWSPLPTAWEYVGGCLNPGPSRSSEKMRQAAKERWKSRKESQ